MRTTFALLLVPLVFSTAARADDLPKWEFAISLRPTDGAMYDGYATEAFRQGKYEEAITKLNEGITKADHYEQGYYWLAYAYKHKHDWQHAAENYRRYIGLHPEKGDAYFGLGAVLVQLGDKLAAKAAYEKYIELEKSPAKQKFIEQSKAAVADINRELTPPAADPREREAAGDRALAAGSYTEAENAFHTALSADGKNGRLKEKLGRTLYLEKRTDDAVKVLYEAVQLDAKAPIAWYNLGRALRKAGKFNDAITAYRTYSQLQPDDVDVYYGLGETYKAAGDRVHSIEALRKYATEQKKPESRQLVDKARAEIQALEAEEIRAHQSGKLPEE